MRKTVNSLKELCINKRELLNMFTHTGHVLQRHALQISLPLSKMYSFMHKQLKLLVKPTDVWARTLTTQKRQLKRGPFSMHAYFEFSQQMQREFFQIEQSSLLTFMQAQTLGIIDTPETYFVVVPCLWKTGDNREL